MTPSPACRSNTSARAASSDGCRPRCAVTITSKRRRVPHERAAALSMYGAESSPSGYSAPTLGGLGGMCHRVAQELRWSRAHRLSDAARPSCLRLARPPERDMRDCERSPARCTHVSQSLALAREGRRLAHWRIPRAVRNNVGPFSSRTIRCRARALSRLQGDEPMSAAYKTAGGNSQ